MAKVYIWGAGYYLEYVYNEIIKEYCEIIGIIDNDLQKQGKMWRDGMIICSPASAVDCEYDYIVVSVKNYSAIEKQCQSMGVPSEKVICYWKDDAGNRIVSDRMKKLRETINKCNVLEATLANAPYEWNIKSSGLQIRNGVELLKKIIKEKSSLVRYGDGEFEIMLHRERAWFQNVRDDLSFRLREIISNRYDNIIIAIADNYGNLDKYNEAAAEAIRLYNWKSRDDIMQFLDVSRVYYDAYVSRPYILYNSSDNAKEIFRLFKEVWRDKNILVVEGKYGRIGVGNDLFATANSVKRIVCPAQNAWDSYDLIFNEVKKRANKDDLICISLGPTATVLAYDLAKCGWQALDIGQLDNEYEWYIRQADTRISIQGKMVAEIQGNQDFKLLDESEYRNQVIVEI